MFLGYFVYFVVINYVCCVVCSSTLIILFVVYFCCLVDCLCLVTACFSWFICWLWLAIADCVVWWWLVWLLVWLTCWFALWFCCVTCCFAFVLLDYVAICFVD